MVGDPGGLRGKTAGEPQAVGAGQVADDLRKRALGRALERIIIASRRSRLAMWQSEHVAGELRRLYPRCEVSVLGITTRGDRIVDRPLAQVGGKGLFVKELEAALEDERADLAVHSAKDVPMRLPQGFCLAAFTAREDPRDCLVSNVSASLEALPRGSIVGTSSLRREAQLRERHPALQVKPLRGNLDTRLAKLDRGECQAIVLAAAGLKRLGLAARIRAMLEPEESLPAPGQGALVIECREERSELRERLAPLDDAPTSACVLAERALSRALSGDCQLPLAAYAVAGGAQIRPREHAAALAARIRAAGGDPVLFPTIEILLPDDPGAAADLIARLDEFQLAIFVSPTAAIRGCGMAGAGRAWPSGLRVAAVGAGTAEALKERGLHAVIAPAGEADSEALAALPELQDLRGRSVVIFRGQRGGIEAVSITSAEGLANFLEMLGPTGAGYLRATPVFVPHPRIAIAAERLGVRRIIVTGRGDDRTVAEMAAFFARV